MAPTLCSLRRTAIRSARICASMMTSAGFSLSRCAVARSPVEVEEEEGEVEQVVEQVVEEEEEEAATRWLMLEERRRWCDVGFLATIAPLCERSDDAIRRAS